jgi:C_GCAxxG_C_C family probable redox protein
MGKYGEKAKALFVEGYNCAQAVFGAFNDVTGIDFETSLKLSSGFGGGMGRMREVCGAVSGMFMVLNAVEGYTSPTDNVAKMELYAKVQKLAEKFKETNGSIVCREIVKDNVTSTPAPTERNAEFYKKRPCAEYVEMAADIVADYLGVN